ncbi:MAG: hypothetical protein QM765_47360 [Myxococcales bacterium]
MRSLMAWIVRELEANRLDPERARAMTMAAQTLLKSIETATLEKKIKDFEASRRAGTL